MNFDWIEQLRIDLAMELVWAADLVQKHKNIKSDGQQKWFIWRNLHRFCINFDLEYRDYVSRIW